MNFLLICTPAFLASDFEILPTWLKLMANSDWVSGSLNLVLWLTPFLITLIGLHVILFKPMMSYLSERDNETIGARKQAKELHANVDQRMEELNAKLQVAKAEAGQLRSDARAKATAKGQVLIDTARSNAETQVSEAIARIHVERDTATQALKQTAEGLSSDIAGQVLGRALEA
jgi:F-type H+-transporting ATPase subunit b